MGDNQTEEKRGYKHPPKEHRFKPGQKPPPRKKKRASSKTDARQLFWRVLQEPRRAIVDGKRGWFSTSDLIVRKAFAVAEQGNSTLNRLLNQLLLRGENAADDHGYELILEPDHPTPEIFSVEITETHEYVDGEIRKKR
jgi:hypothetical protein